VKFSLHKILIVCCALYLSGAHWLVLQTTAWTGMLISRSVSSSVADAFESTFDGQHPCPMCSAIADGKQSEQRTEKNFNLLKKVGEVKFLEVSSKETVPVFAVDSVGWPVPEFQGYARFEAPPSPPPLA